jgi:hypothetical protein
MSLSIYLSIYLWPYSPCRPWSLFQFLNLYAVSRTPWTGDQPVARPLTTHRSTQTQNKRTQTSMSLVKFEPTIPVFERAKTIHALDRAATVIGRVMSLCDELLRRILMVEIVAFLNIQSRNLLERNRKSIEALIQHSTE